MQYVPFRLLLIKAMISTVAFQVLGGIADTVAQTLTAYRSRSRTLPSNAKNSLISIEFQEFGKEKPAPLAELPAAKAPPAPFDFERLTRFMAYGFIMAPVQFQWFGFLSRALPLVKGRSTVPALQRVAMDQLIFAPIGKCHWIKLDSGSKESRSELLLHLHDRRRGRWTTGDCAQVSGCVHAGPEGQLHALACGPNSQLSSGSYTISNCMLLNTITLKTIICLPSTSPLYPLLGLPGPPTCLLRTLRMKTEPKGSTSYL